MTTDLLATARAWAADDPHAGGGVVIGFDARRRSDEEMAELGFDPELVARVDRMIASSEFKRQVPPIAKLGPRTAGVDYLYPRRRPGSARR